VAVTLEKSQIFYENFKKIALTTVYQKHKIALKLNLMYAIWLLSGDGV